MYSYIIPHVSSSIKGGGAGTISCIYVYIGTDKKCARRSRVIFPRARALARALDSYMAHQRQQQQQLEKAPAQAWLRQKQPPGSSHPPAISSLANASAAAAIYPCIRAIARDGDVSKRESERIFQESPIASISRRVCSFFLAAQRYAQKVPCTRALSLSAILTIRRTTARPARRRLSRHFLHRLLQACSAVCLSLAENCS